MVKKGELTLHKDTRQGSTSRDKSKYASKNREVVHDGVVDHITPKLAKVAFNLTDNLKASKQAEKPPSDKQVSGNRPRNSWATCPKREFTPLGELLDVVYKALLQKKNSYPHWITLDPTIHSLGHLCGTRLRTVNITEIRATRPLIGLICVIRFKI